MNLGGTEFSVDAQVNETLTGITMKKHAVKRDIKKRSVQLSFSGTSTRFKPGLPFKYVVGDFYGQIFNHILCYIISFTMFLVK